MGKSAKRRTVAKHLAASRQAEVRYVRDVLAIMANVHADALRVAKARHTASSRADAGDGFGKRFRAHVFRYVAKEVPPAHDRMAAAVAKKNAAGAKKLGLHPGRGSLIGVSPKAVGIERIVENARAANVRLITRASDTFLDQIEEVLREGFGDRVEDLAEALQERVGVSNSRAALIARDQTTKLNAAISQHRQTQAGVERFIWSTSHDERVRASHAELDGRTFSWAEGLPADVAEEVDEEEGATPGTPVACRCVAVPVMDDEESEGEPEPDDEEEAAE